MTVDFDHIEYLASGNRKQRRAYLTLVKCNLFCVLQAFNPKLVGTIPIGIDIENSDLDIICEVKDRHTFKHILSKHFGNSESFKLKEHITEGEPVVIAGFKLDEFEIEVFGMNRPTKEQNAYRHMLIEHRILQQKGEDFRLQIIRLKRAGYKTEPAFASLLGLSGDPYFQLLNPDILKQLPESDTERTMF